MKFMFKSLSSLAVAWFISLNAACTSGEVPAIDCSTATVKSFSELESLAYCVECHGSNRADKGIRYDSYDGAVQSASAGERSIADGSMPPDSDMPEAMVLEFSTWVQCGQPE